MMSVRIQALDMKEQKGLFKDNFLISQQKHTVELEWLKHLWNHENMFETRVV